MSWLKDNLIAVLGVMCVILALGWIISGYRAAASYSKLETEFTTTKNDFNNAAEANKTNQTALAHLLKVNNELIAQQKLDQTAAAAAAARQVQLAARIEATLSENARLREVLAQENPDVRTYLDAGMPCELARSLWGSKAGACSN